MARPPPIPITQGEYEGSTLKLEHGGVTISTSKLLAMRAGNVLESPVSNVWTEVDVRDVDGSVRIAARKGNLTISDNTGTTTLAEGQQTTRDDSQSDNKKRKKDVSPAAATSPVSKAFDSAPSDSFSISTLEPPTTWQCCCR